VRDEQTKFINININVPICIKIPENNGTNKFLPVLLRMITDKNGKNLLTFQNIADLLGFKCRRDIDNYWREFKQKGSNFVSFLTRKSELSKHVDIIRDIFIKNPLLNTNELYEMFKNKYPDVSMSIGSFVKYFGELDANFVLQSIHKCLDKNNSKIDNDYLISYLAENIEEKVIKKKIVNIDNEIKKDKPKIPKVKNRISTNTLSLLVIFLVGSNMSYDTISFLLNISKGYINKLVHNVHNVREMILSSIDKWSGKICVDEKYVKLNGAWRYIFSAVDKATGIPLMVKYFEHKNALSWEIFFQIFKEHYGTPKLIISDGCQSLANGRNAVFPNVSFQLCKFHKMKNLINKIYQSKSDPENKKQAIEKLKQVFARETTGGRRKALLELEKILYGEVKIYFQERILKKWKNLTKSLTSNAAERWNRKIEKTVSGKYGLKNSKTAQQMVDCLWFCEMTTKGTQHLSKESLLSNLNFAKICQEIISKERLEHLFTIDKQRKVA
jgi:transposase-like protein